MSHQNFWQHHNLAENAPDIGKRLFGSPKKLAIGIWIAELDVHSIFSTADAVEAYAGKVSPDSNIGGYLREWSQPELNMLTKLHEPQLRAQRYERTDSDLWGIYAAAKIALANS